MLEPRATALRSVLAKPCRAGCSRKLSSEAAERSSIAITVNAGAALIYSARVMDAYDHKA
jgi:hypothetical protein